MRQGPLWFILIRGVSCFFFFPDTIWCLLCVLMSVDKSSVWILWIQWFFGQKAIDWYCAIPCYMLGHANRSTRQLWNLLGKWNTQHRIGFFEHPVNNEVGFWLLTEFELSCEFCSILGNHTGNYVFLFLVFQDHFVSYRSFGVATWGFQKATENLSVPHDGFSWFFKQHCGKPRLRWLALAPCSISVLWFLNLYGVAWCISSSPLAAVTGATTSWGTRSGTSGGHDEHGTTMGSASWSEIWHGQSPTWSKSFVSAWHINSDPGRTIALVIYAYPCYNMFIVFLACFVGK